jgi:hypothetical protein
MIRKLFFAIALALLGTGALAQNTLPNAVASGNKVFVQIVNDSEYPLPADEIEDVTRELAAAGSWACVADPEEADFILKVEAKKKMVFNSPRTWLTPSVLDKSGNVLWEGKTQKADATMFNGFQSTNACIAKVIEKSFESGLFKNAGR